MAAQSEFIVGEVAKIWSGRNFPEGTKIVGNNIPGTISSQFHQMIEVNFDRGYLLQDWKYSQIMTGPEEITEVIIAVFRRMSDTTDNEGAK